MRLHFAAICLFATSSSPFLLAQQPDAAPGAPAAAPQAQKADALRHAFVDAEGQRRLSIAAAAEQVLERDAAGRAKFMATVRAIDAVAPKQASKPESGAGAGSAPAEKAVEFGDEIKQLMATVVTGAPDAASAALAKLAADPGSGAAALARLDERGDAILSRCLLSFLRKKLDTNAMYAGQYDALKDFQPEAAVLLLRWAQQPPKDAPRPETFGEACVRALRDVVPADQATDALRASLREIAAKAQQASDQQRFLTAACALHQYGDPSVFDAVKASVEKMAASEDPQQKTAGTSTLAELHYQLRKYEDAANYYKTLVDLIERTGQQPQGLTTMVYNTACSLSLAKRTDEAFQYLEKALALAAKTRSLSKVMIDSDHDMNNLREDPRFAQLMEKYYGKPGPQGK